MTSTGEKGAFPEKLIHLSISRCSGIVYAILFYFILLVIGFSEFGLGSSEKNSGLPREQPMQDHTYIAFAFVQLFSIGKKLNVQVHVQSFF